MGIVKKIGASVKKAEKSAVKTASSAKKKVASTIKTAKRAVDRW